MQTRTWNNGNSPIATGGLFNWCKKFGKPELATKVEDMQTLWIINSNLRIRPNKICAHVHQETCTVLFKQLYSKWSQTRNSVQVHPQRNGAIKLSYIWAMQCWTACKQHMDNLVTRTWAKGAKHNKIYTAEFYLYDVKQKGKSQAQCQNSQ